MNDIESILESGGNAALKTFIEESTVRLHDLMEHGTLEDIKADLQYRARTVDWLRTKASTEQEEIFLIGYYCGILSEYEAALKKRFQEEGNRKTCDALNSLNMPNLKSIIRVIYECPGIGHRRLSKITCIPEAELYGCIAILAQYHAIIISKPIEKCYYQATPAGLKYAGIELPENEKVLTIPLTEWKQFHKRLTSNLEPCDHYDMGYRDAADQIDDWMDADIHTKQITPACGHWEFVNDYESQCTNCGETSWIDHENEHRFCPNCGAKMDPQ